VYIPEHFRSEDQAAALAFMRANPFAILISTKDSEPFASHIPVVIREQGGQIKLRGHVAKANPHWRYMGEQPRCLLIFHGPHAYISPFWYETEEAVPTWNYATVHAYGTATIIRDEIRTKQLVETLTRLYEGDRAEELFDRWSEPFVTRMLKGIVAFEVQVTRLEGKFKLGQNRIPADIASTYHTLRHSSDPNEQALAKLMQEHGIGTE